MSKFEVAKFGWLQRQSSVLKRWKRNWFIVYTNGRLEYFECPDSSVASESELVQTQLLSLMSGTEISDVKPPKGVSKECLLTLIMVDQRWNLCADSPEDVRAWRQALEEARKVAPPAPPRRTFRYGTHPPPYVVEYPADNTTVIYVNQRPAYYYYDDDMATGMLLGAAVGSMMWGPLYW